MPEDDLEYKSFTVISIDSLLVCEKKSYLQIYLDNFAYKIIDTQKCISENTFEPNEN